MYTQLKRLTLLLLATAILTMICVFMVFVLQRQVHDLKQQVNLREQSWDKQLKFNEAQQGFDKAVTDRLTK